MYRQVELDKADRDFHLILWRSTADGPVETLRMSRVTFGVASSLYHSIRSLGEDSNLSEVPTEVQRAILKIFMLMTTSLEPIRSMKLEYSKRQLVGTLKRGRVDLRKWTSNKSSIILDLPPEYREAKETLKFLDKDHTKKRLVLFDNTAKIASFLRFPASERKNLKEKFDQKTNAQ